MAEEWEDGGGWAVDDLDDPTSRHELSADGALGEEYRAMKAAKAKARSPVRDPYHNAVEEPVAGRERQKESFRLMVVGEAGLGKTTLLESFFKSFKDDEALFALFERKETQTVIETRRQLDDAAARRARNRRSCCARLASACPSSACNAATSASAARATPAGLAAAAAGPCHTRWSHAGAYRLRPARSR